MCNPLEQMLRNEGNADEADALHEFYNAGRHVTRPEVERNDSTYEPEPEYDPFHSTNTPTHTH